LPFASHDVACLTNVKEQICHSMYKECAEVNGTFVPALMWFVQVNLCWILSGLFVHLVKKSLLVVFLSFCGIFLQPERVWKEKGHLERLCCEDQGRSGSKERLWYTDACCDGPDGSVHSNWLIYVVLFDRVPLCCISLALGTLFVWGTSLPLGPNGERNPYRFLECNVQGGDANQIQGADAVLAWLFSQLPFVSGYNPNAIVSLSWPRNMAPQDLFPLTSSTYTFPTGVKVEVPCFAQTKVVDIERTECPDSFVSPIDPNNVRPCVKVLPHGSARRLHP
jgi:hypothetical protein